MCPDGCEDRCLNGPERCGLSSRARKEPAARKYPVSFDTCEAQRLWDLGYTDSEIGEALGVHRNTIYNWRVKSGIGKSRKKKDWEE